MADLCRALLAAFRLLLPPWGMARLRNGRVMDSRAAVLRTQSGHARLKPKFGKLSTATIRPAAHTGMPSTLGVLKPMTIQAASSFRMNLPEWPG